MKILVLDDEIEIAHLLSLYLENEGYEVYKFNSPKDAIRCIDEVEMDLAILDVMLPEIDGFEICRYIRERYTYPVIMLTAKDENNDKISGLAIGADDYITKPFNPLEVVARVKAQLRRYKKYNTAQTEKPDIYEIGGLVINRSTHECTLLGKEINLTPLEFNILWLLCEKDGNVVSSEEIFKRVWGEKYLDGNNTVMVHIRRLREKLGEKPREPRYIKTVWGVGYKIGK